MINNTNQTSTLEELEGGFYFLHAGNIYMCVEPHYETAGAVGILAVTGANTWHLVPHTESFYVLTFDEVEDAHLPQSF